MNERPNPTTVLHVILNLHLVISLSVQEGKYIIYVSIYMINTAIAISYLSNTGRHWAYIFINYKTLHFEAYKYKKLTQIFGESSFIRNLRKFLVFVCLEVEVKCFGINKYV